MQIIGCCKAMHKMSLRLRSARHLGVRPLYDWGNGLCTLPLLGCGSRQPYRPCKSTQLDHNLVSRMRTACRMESRVSFSLDDVSRKSKDFIEVWPSTSSRNSEASGLALTICTKFTCRIHSSISQPSLFINPAHTISVQT